MSESNVVKLEDHKIDPIRPAMFGVAEHQYRRFNARVPAGTLIDDITNPALWVHIGKQLQAEDEIRVVADDCSFVATLFVHFVSGSDVRVGLLHKSEFGDVETTVVNDNSKFEVILLGKRKFVVRDRKSGEVKFEGIPTRSAAQKQLEELERALSN